jgi:hypothetical protein
MRDVLQFPAPSTLRLEELVGANGKGVISTWLSSYPGARARFGVRVRYLRRMPPAQWHKKQFRYLEDGLAEIKWDFGKKEFRAVGFYRGEFFLMVIGCTHKGKVYDPHRWLETAKRRKSEVENEQWSTVEHEP